MKFGICTSVGNSAAVKDAGWDFVEATVGALLQGQKPDSEWDGPRQIEQAVVPVPSANVLVPGSLKITGPEADMEKLREYMTVVMRRAGKIGMSKLVFGSGGARNVPEGFSRDEARKQILAFVRMSAELAGRNGITLVAEPLHKAECNIINTVAEAMTYVREIDHPNFQCLVDSYHFWLEDEPLENLEKAMPWIKHVHLADKVGRTPPGESGNSDYRPFFKVLKQGGYDGLIAVEASNFDVPEMGPRVMEFTRKQWNEA